MNAAPPPGRGSQAPSPGSSTAPRLEAGPHKRWPFVAYGLLLLVVATTATRFVIPHRDWEILTTKHYFDAGFFCYGGWARSYVQAAGGLRTIQVEALPNYLNLPALAETASPRASQHHVVGFQGTERLLTPFCLLLLLRVNFLGLDVWTLFLILNLLLWFLAILFAAQLARLYFEDPYSRFCAALLISVYPVFTVTFHAIKVQQIGTVFLLGAALLYETRIVHLPRSAQVASLAALLFLGLFACGGWLFLLGFLLVRHVAGGRERVLARVAVTFSALGLASLLYRGLDWAYDLPSAERYLSLSYGGLLQQSAAWLKAFLAGRDVSDLVFLNYPGFTLFTRFLPLVSAGFLRTHWALLLLAIVAGVISVRVRWLLGAAAVLFFLGHSGMMLSGWVFHYGYLSAPAGVMTLLAAAHALGLMGCHRRRSVRVIAATVTGMLLLMFLTSEKTQVGVYYGSDRMTEYGKNTYVCYGGERPCARY